jgi:hypothetical protein
MKSLRVVLAAVFGFAVGAVLFHTSTVKAQSGAKVQSVQPGMAYQKITGTPVAMSCLGQGQQGVVCYVLTQGN